MWKGHFQLVALLTASLCFSSFALEAATKKTRVKVYAQEVNIPSEREMLEMETRLVKMVNNERTKHGLSPLKVWQVLTYHAREHSRDMAEGEVDFGHDGFTTRAQAVFRRMGLKSFGENVAYNYLYDDPLKKAVDGWMKSPKHRDNILGEYNDTGIGIAYSSEGRCYLTQLFSKRPRN